jgi:predicted NAD/FAD-binding protein
MTKAERLKIYENFFHQVNVYCITMNNEKLQDAVGLISSWSYAHRVGNGELSDSQQRKRVENVINKMKEYV